MVCSQVKLRPKMEGESPDDDRSATSETCTLLEKIHGYPRNEISIIASLGKEILSQVFSKLSMKGRALAHE